MQAAGQEARERFSQCPICRRLVCDACFLICDEMDLCRECAGRMEESGEAGGAMKMRWLPILLLCLLLAGCSVETSEGHLVPVAEGSREYSSALDPFLPGYTLSRGRGHPLRGIVPGQPPVACFDVQAVPAMARGVGRYWYPHVSATVVLAVDRTRTDAVVTGWNSLRENRVPVGMSSTSIVRNMLVLGALSYGLNPKEPSKREALDFLEHLCPERWI